MRVIAGIYKGRKLKAPETKEVRPTKDRIKESMFDIIKPYLQGADVLELFAGSGSLGIEALSRGAKSITLVERDLICIKTIEENFDMLGLKPPVACLVQGDIFKAIRSASEHNEKFGIVVADPPYGMGHIRKLLIKLNNYDILKKPHLIVIEHSEDEDIPQIESGIVLQKQYKYGYIILSILVKEA